MDLKKEIRKHRKTAYVLTAAETAAVIGLVAQMAGSPLLFLLSPLRSICSASTRVLAMVAAAQIHLGTKAMLRTARVPRHLLFLFFCTSQTLFTYCFLSQMSLATGLCMGCSCIVCSLVFSLSSTLLMVYNNHVLWTGPVYTRIRGLFAFLARRAGPVVGNTVHLCAASTAATASFLGLYVLALRTVFSWMRHILPLQISWSISRSFLLTTISNAVYFFLMGIVDELLVYNSSLTNASLGEFVHDAEEDLETSRLRFFQSAELCMRLPQMLRRTAKSHHIVTSLEAYIRRERMELLRILDQMKREHEILNSRMWLSIPQVTAHSDKPRALVGQKKLHFVKKIRSYNFIEINAARIVCFWRTRVLASRFCSARTAFLMIRDFVRFLSKHEEDYLLLKDLGGAFAASARAVQAETADVEQRTGARLESGAFE